MKRHIIALGLALLLAVSVAVAQQTEPTISFVNDTHDFGKIKETDGAVTVRFEFTNTGAKPLIINGVSASCGCTTPDWTKNPIPPAGKGFVSAMYNPAGRPGVFQKTVTVNSNAANGSIVLKIKGEVVEKEKGLTDKYPYKMGNLLLTSNHIPFMNIFSNKTVTKMHDIANNSDLAMTVTFQQVPPHLSIKTEPAVLQPKQEGKIVVTYNAEMKGDWDYVFDNLQVYINGTHDAAHFLTISANITEDFSQITPDQKAKAPKVEFESTEFDFGTIKPNEKVTHEFKFTNTGKSNLDIRKIKASCGCTAVSPNETSIAPGKSSTLKVVFDSEGKTGVQNKVITVVTNDPDNQRIVLFIKGNIQ